MLHFIAFEPGIEMTRLVDTSGMHRFIADLPALSARVAVLAAIWWVLTGGETSSWDWGVPAVLVAASLRPGLGSGGAWRLSLMGLLRFLPAFVWYNMRGALEVAILALDPRRHPDPVLIGYPLRLPPGPARVFMANLINLVPGTLSTRLTVRGIEIHVLTASVSVTRTLTILERRVADLFALQLAPGAVGDSQP
ncbi:MAG: cation:proton antiporter [Gammaproteobacteria bacterium]|nr:MAG: cation:proton antiporter [Gammaproteobacteria bacterium]